MQFIDIYSVQHLKRLNEHPERQRSNQIIKLTMANRARTAKNPPSEIQLDPENKISKTENVEHRTQDAGVHLAQTSKLRGILIKEQLLIYIDFK